MVGLCNALLAAALRLLSSRADVSPRHLEHGAVWVRGPSGLEEPQAVAAGGVALLAPRPNPCSSTATIDFVLPRDGDVRLSIYDVLGREISTLLNGHRPSGEHVAVWAGAPHGGEHGASGIYYLRLAFRGRVRTERIVFVP
ncbi:MAG: T9SS type A sorting domain-containing protein [Candidatus Eisenbacteria bacterium]|nr:T9SS type A sorting domain-containing protein [Candidatus Eisenbacteria bacterium]